VGHDDAADLNHRILQSIGLVFQSMDWQSVLPRIVQAVRRCFDADTASLLLPHAAPGAFIVAFSEVDTREGPKATGQICEDGVAVRVAATGRPTLIVGPLDRYPLFAGLASRSSGSSLVYPVAGEADGELAGVLTANRGEGRPAFAERDLEALGTVASFVRMAIRNADLYRRLQLTTEDLRRQIAERARMEAELRLAQKLEAVGQLAAGVAHEINTPIQYVGDSIDFLRESFATLIGVLGRYRTTVRALGGEVAGPLVAEEEQADLPFVEAEAPQAFERTSHGIKQVAKIVQAMKQFAHPGRAQRMEPADLNQAIETTLTVARSEYKLVADVETELGQLPPVVCDIGDLNQVFLNLVVNAAHAIQDAVGDSGGRGQIRIRTRGEGDLALVTISDTGCGIPEGIRERIFDPFFTTKESGRGTGQGLAIARSIIVERHRGTLSFVSTVGTGTTFFVRLPVAGPPRAGQAR
jgi:signal transduction histidine kinase